jgi:protein tyrosine phosphatase (PTP) superfamily phosphohydrolase (DUF442 family)
MKNRPKKGKQLGCTMAMLALCCASALADPAILDVLPDSALQPSDDRYVTGRLDGPTIVRLQQLGMAHVIDLSLDAETPLQDERSEVQATGMQYHAIPVADGNDLNLTKVRQLDALLMQIGDAPAVLHCASGNRVGALMALRAGWIHGADPEQALLTGRQWGLTRLAPVVEALLRNPQH